MVGKDARLTRFAVFVWVLAAGAAAAQSTPLLVDGTCRDGVPHGRYELRTPTGALRVAGAFNHGKRTGSFIFWSASGSRTAHIPYDDDSRNGTLASWYEAASGGEPQRRFQSTWRHGVREGVTRTWYRDGRRRTEADFVRGAIVASVGWSAAGARLSDPAAREAVERDLAVADAEYAELESMLRTRPPHCD